MRVLVIGARGRMGAMACAALETDRDFQVVGRIGRGDDLEAALDDSPDVALELTTPATAGANAITCLERACPVVIGATGLSSGDTDAIRAAATDVGAMIVPNFAIGAVLMMRFSALAARWMPDVEILEIHHERKADAPSGTALRTAELISDARRRAPSPLPPETLKVTGARGGEHRNVRVHSMRLPGHVASQQVVFGGPGESLTIRHDAIDRTVYAPGIKLALRRVGALDRLEIGLDSALFKAE